MAALTATLLLAILPACHTQRQTSSPAPTETTAAVDGYRSMVEAYLPWQRLRVPFTLKLLAPQKVSIGGTATFERSKGIHKSMKMFGMEVAVLQVDADSLTVVEKMNKQYLTIPVASALGGLDASVDNIQDLLTGRAFILGADSLTTSMARLFTIADPSGATSWLLTPRKQPAEASYSFAISSTGALSALRVDTRSNQQANATYTSIPSIPGHGAFASSMLVTTRVKDKDLQLMIEWDFSRARWDDDVEPKSITIGRGYKQLSIDKLLKNLPAPTN